MPSQRTLLDGDTGQKFDSSELLVGRASVVYESYRFVWHRPATVAAGTAAPSTVRAGFMAFTNTRQIICPRAGFLAAVQYNASANNNLIEDAQFLPSLRENDTAGAILWTPAQNVTQNDPQGIIFPVPGGPTFAAGLIIAPCWQYVAGVNLSSQNLPSLVFTIGYL